MAKRRTRWTPAEAHAVLDELDASGLSMAEFGRRHDLQPNRLQRWRKRLGRAPETPEPRLVELTPRVPGRCSRVHIHCPSGHVIELAEVSLLEGLRAAVSAVSEVSGC